MLKSISRSIAFLALALIPLSSATAQEDDAKIVASVPTEVADKVKALEREVRELRQANEILRKASAYFAQAELDRPFRR